MRDDFVGELALCKEIIFALEECQTENNVIDVGERDADTL